MATAPFNDGQGDIILRTSDNVDFYVFRLVLSLASPFFRSMFSLPQPELLVNAGSDTTQDTTFPVVTITENSQTIDYLLRFIYPIIPPTSPNDLTLVSQIIEAACCKYELETAMAPLKSHLLTFIAPQPLKVYTISCQLQMEEEARAAARALRESYLRDPPSPMCYHIPRHTPVETCPDEPWIRDPEHTLYSSEMRAAYYFRLVRFVRTGEMEKFCGPSDADIVVAAAAPDAARITVSPPSMPDAAFLQRWPADIMLKSSDEALLPTHKMILAIASADTILDKSDAADCPSHEGLPMVKLDDDKAKLEVLLYICYTLGTSECASKLTAEQALSAYVTASKYSMVKVMKVTQTVWLTQMKNYPLRLYLTAAIFGWVGEANEAAQSCVQLPVRSLEDSYVQEMEAAPATALYHLYKFKHDRHKARTNVVFRRLNIGTAAWCHEDLLQDLSVNVPMVAAPLIFQRRLNAGMRRGSNRNTGVQDILDLVRNSHALSHDINQALSNVHLGSD